MEANIRERSGEVNSDDPLVTFLYLLMRDHLPVGDVEEIMRKLGPTTDGTQFSNGWLAEYAKDISRRLK